MEQIYLDVLMAAVKLCKYEINEEAEVCLSLHSFQQCVFNKKNVSL